MKPPTSTQPFFLALKGTLRLQTSFFKNAISDISGVTRGKQLSAVFLESRRTGLTHRFVTNWRRNASSAECWRIGATRFLPEAQPRFLLRYIRQDSNSFAPGGLQSALQLEVNPQFGAYTQPEMFISLSNLLHTVLSVTVICESAWGRVFFGPRWRGFRPFSAMLQPRRGPENRL